MTTLSTLPTYAAPGREIKILLTLTNPTANFVRVRVTNAPPGSYYRKKLDDSTQNRFDAFSGEGGSSHPWRSNNFDVGGKYTLVVQEYVRGASGYGGGYQKSPDGAPSETKVGTETTLELFVGQRLTSPIKVGEDAVTVALWVWGDSIRQTTVADHGEESPALTADSATPRASVAVESATVQTALNVLRNQVVTDAVGNVGTVLADIIAKWNAHLSQASVHQNNDGVNGLAVGLGGSPSAGALATAIAEILPRVRNHYTNDATFGATTFGRDSGDYHNVSGKKNDNANLPTVQGVSDLTDGYWAVADLARSYEAHRASVDVHDSADGTNALSARPLLMQLGEAVLVIFAATAVTSPATQSTGAMKLITAAGFSETPL
jgi:hypothetical protein